MKDQGIIHTFNLAGTFIPYLLSIKWFTSTLLAIIFFGGFWFAGKKNNIATAIIVSIITVGGSYGIYQNNLITIGVGILASTCLLILSIYIP